ncbi:aminotransferase-like domain-containing protein [Streptococcus dentiloxodontae]
MTSKYSRICQDIKQNINQGLLKKGDKIPSIRKLSKAYGCSKDTVQHALLELKYQNILYAVHKSGYYVLEGMQENDELDISLTDYSNRAYEDFRLCVNESLEGRENYLFNYYHQQEGLEALIASFQKQLEDTGVYSKKKNIVVTSGSQQALYILTQMDFPNNKEMILLEQPTYHRMNDLVRSQNLPYMTIKRDFQGLDFKKLEELFQNYPIKCFYTISRYSNPLGLTYHLQEKQALAELAYKYDVYIIEDDYMGDFAKTGDLPIHYYDTHEKVIYLKSFSMTLFPALRLSSLVLPQNLTRSFLDYKRLIDYDTNLIMQKALSLYIDNGMFAKNLKYLNRVFAHHMKQTLAKLAKYQITKNYVLAPHFVSLYLTDAKSDSLIENYMNRERSHYLRLTIDEKLSYNLEKWKSHL